MAEEQDTAIPLPAISDLTYREIHAFIDGVYVGYVDGEQTHEYSREGHYWRAGYLVGEIILNERNY
jgi:hypothetical protein